LSDLQQIMLGTYFAQALACALLTIMLAAFWRRYRRPYLAFWALAWAAVALFHIGAALAMSVMTRFDPASALRTSFTIAVQCLGYLQVAWMLLGTRELSSRRTITRRAHTVLILAVCALSTAIAFASLELELAPRLYLKLGLRAAFASLIFGYAALTVWRSRGSGDGFGKRWISIALGVYALEQFNYVALLVGGFSPLPTELWSIYLGLFDILLHASIGLGMVAWHLDEERARAIEAAGALRKSEELLQRTQRMDVVGRLAGGVAHDFNNLLTGILGYVELIRESSKSSDIERRYLAGIEQSAERASSLTAQLLTFARRQVGQPCVLDLNAELRRLEPMLARILGRTVRLDLALDPDLACVRVDPAQLEQIVFNLVLNARDALSRGGSVRLITQNERLGSGTAQALGIVPGDYVSFSIQDDGAGMDESVLAHLFEPFFTTKAVGKGSGLGLSTVYGIVTQASGAVTIESGRGKGTRVDVRLPATRERALEVEPGGSSFGQDAKGETVLIVEDEMELQELFTRTLERAGYRVLCAGNGSQALALSNTHTGMIQVLVTDLVMPVLGGRELARELCLRRPETRVIFVTGLASEALEKQAPPSTPTRLLKKPFTPQALVAMVRGLLDESGRVRRSGPITAEPR
jgi:signal transduction histidine kinase/CheY-like chemotaxis protein